ncbi:MAG TPA: GNAT family N-acetyltransferase [Levilinea sp.]|nr:GNAT family N-acetyltransferase [Levilinea sp.]
MYFVDQVLARRLEMGHTWRSVHHARAYQHMHPDARVKIEAAGPGFAIFEKPGSPLNRCSGLGMDGPVDAATIDFVEVFYRACHEPAHISLCPLADPSLKEMLRERGYRLEHFYTVLARHLPIAEGLAELPEGVLIRRMTPEMAELWLDTVAGGFSAPHEPDEEMLDILGSNFYAANAITFLAYIDHQPAGGGGMYLHGGVAEFGGASTLLPFRRRGVQTALLQARLQAARLEGCDTGMVLTSPGSHSQRNLQRLGFEVAYSLAIMVSE